MGHWWTVSVSVMGLWLLVIVVVVAAVVVSFE